MVAFADALTTVSPTYAREIQTPAHGFGLDGILAEKSADLVGVLNGIDTEEWNPETDPHIAIRFGRGPWPPLECEPFLDDEWFPVASPKFNRGKLPREPKDLLRLRIMREDRDSWQGWFKAAGVPLEAPLEGPLFNDSTYSLQAAARGEGIALARRSIVGEDLERGTLKRLFKVSLPAPERYWFVSPKERANAPAVKAFRDWVKSELR